MDAMPPADPVPVVLAPLPPVPQRAARVVLSAAVLALGVYTLWSFLPALVWASIFAVALWPWYARLQAKCSVGSHDILLPGAFTLGVALVFIVPLGMIGLQLAHEAHQAMDWVKDARANGIPEPAIMHRIPLVSGAVDTWWQANLADPGSAADLLERFSHGNAMEYSRHLSRIVLHRITLFAFTLVTLFFLFRDGPSLAAQMQRASLRSFGPSGDRISRQIIASIHGTVDGLVLVGLGEGLLLGIVYAVAGVPHPSVLRRRHRAGGDDPVRRPRGVRRRLAPVGGARVASCGRSRCSCSAC